LLDADLDISAIQPRDEEADKARIREIMARKKEPRLDDTNISSIPPNSNLRAHPLESEEDDFDKLIGHIEGGDHHNQNKEVSLEDFF
jgi:hypothetical protein